MPEAIGSAAYQPPPPPPVLAPLANSGKSSQTPPAVTAGTAIADIKFATGSTTLSDEDRQGPGRFEAHELDVLQACVGVAGQHHAGPASHLR